MKINKFEPKNLKKVNLYLKEELKRKKKEHSLLLKLLKGVKKLLKKE